MEGRGEFWVQRGATEVRRKNEEQEEERSRQLKQQKEKIDELEKIWRMNSEQVLVRGAKGAWRRIWSKEIMKIRRLEIL